VTGSARETKAGAEVFTQRTVECLHQASQSLLILAQAGHVARPPFQRLPVEQVSLEQGFVEGLSVLCHQTEGSVEMAEEQL
jgi:hypothetical protein